MWQASNTAGAILDGLKRLAVFSGRDSRARFWPYAFAVLAAAVAGMVLLMVPMLTKTIAKMQAFAAQHPEQATVQSSGTSYSITIHGHHPELMPDLGAITPAMTAGFAVVIVLLAAAVSRRLHDRGHSGLWGLAPLPFIGVALTLMPKLFASFGGSKIPPLFFLLFINNVCYLGSLAMLAVLLAGESAPGPNRFGPPPERAT